MDLGQLLDEIEALCVSGGDPGRIVLDVRGVVERTRTLERSGEAPVYVRESAAREERDRENDARGVSQAEARREETAAKEAEREAKARVRGEMAPVPETPEETVARLEEELAPPAAPETLAPMEPIDAEYPEPLPLPEEPVVPADPVPEGDEPA